jgi:outer membrane protein OmpA-like peptidoglycan-associated protein
MKKLLSIIGALAVSLTVFAGTARADNSFQLHLEPGIAQPLTAPQSDIYQTGMVLGAKGMFAVRPYLTVGPSISAMYLPRAIDNGQNAGTIWQFAGSVRLQTDRRTSNRDPLFHYFNPWIDMDLGAAQTGNLTRPVWDLGVGAETPLDQNHIVWMGPFVRFTHIFQTSDTQDTSLLDPRDVNILQVGMSFSFDTPTHRKVVTEQVVVEKEVKVPCPPTQVVVLAPPPPAPKAEKLAITEKVYFDFDKSSLRWESRDKLDAIVAQINAHPSVTLKVEGHASSDGNKLHNVQLSGERTAAVVTYLIKHGVNPSRLTGVALGIDHPAAPNSSKEGRERNRRVEFVVTFTSVDNK